MQKITLYRFIRPDGGVTVSPVKPNSEYTEMFCLVADEGYVLTNGVTTTPCCDTDNAEAWAEVVMGNTTYGGKIMMYEEILT